MIYGVADNVAVDKPLCW